MGGVASIKRLLKKVQKVDQNKILHDIIEDDLMQAQIIDANQRQLYEQGVQADGTETGQYAPITITHYKPLAAAEGRDGRTDHITLKDTGDFYHSMKVVNLSDAFKIEADDPNDLQTVEPQMLGLTEDSRKELLPEIKERFSEALREEILS